MKVWRARRLGLVAMLGVILVSVSACSLTENTGSSFDVTTQVVTSEGEPVEGCWLSFLPVAQNGSSPIIEEFGIATGKNGKATRELPIGKYVVSTTCGELAAKNEFDVGTSNLDVMLTLK